ncbi:MAG TPA: alpha-2-macroglobulin family protein, partial [Fimbriimonadaceae bacterium]|nr:alpha-2-macroglobulin family protein [Fimbriimonadaceae bacterium]
AYWNPSIRTDAAGRATVQVRLPDNLTSWRATATGVSLGTHVGRGSSTMRVRKDLMVRIEAPQFMVQGDQVQVSAFLTNDTGTAQRVRLQVQTDGLTLDGDATREERVEQGRPTRITWTATPRRTGEVSLIAKAWVEGGASDGVESRVPVVPHGRLLMEQTAGELKGQGALKIEVRPGADRPTGRVVLTLSPTLMATLAQSLDDLIGFPYGCTEQTMSRFMPTVVVSEAVKSLGLPAPRQASQIPQMVAEGYTRLERMQHSDGSWGWWEHDVGDPWMTAYVLEGIWRAEKAGFPNPIDLEATYKWCREYLARAGTKEGDATARARTRSNLMYLAYALALHGQSQAAAAALDASDLRAAQGEDLAHAVLAARALGRADLASDLATRLSNALQEQAATAHWQERSYGIETTSRGFAALAAARPDHSALPKIARYIAASRKGGSWISTRDTAYAIIGLGAYMSARGEQLADLDLALLVNDRPYRRLQLSAEDAMRKDLRLTIPFEDLQEGTNRLEIRESSGRTVYYGLDTRQTVVQERLGGVAGDSGLSVERRFYRLEPTRFENGQMRLMASKDPTRRFTAGEPIRAVLTIRARQEHEFIMIEDMLPSNCRVQDRGPLDEGESWGWWYSSRDVRDDRIAFFARRLPAGTHTIEYTMRAEQPGTVRVLPATISNMYAPLSRASSPSAELEVRP